MDEPWDGIDPNTGEYWVERVGDQRVGEIRRRHDDRCSVHPERPDWRAGYCPSLDTHDLLTALARVRAIVESNRKQNILGQFICDDCGKEWPNHDLEFCLVGQIGAALEGQ